MTENSCITITVNIASADKLEGNAEIRIGIHESHLAYLNPEGFNEELARMISLALQDYFDRNEIKE